MLPKRWTVLGALALLVLVLWWNLTAGGPREASPPAKPKLVVLLYFDQLRGDYLVRWQHLFGPGGFRRLTDEGTWFQNCHYPYGMTFTATGHATIVTGALPRTHGIIDNQWFERGQGQEVYCTTVEGRERVPPLRPGKEEDKKYKGGGSPERLLSPTVADALKDATRGRSRVVSLSLKDRSAILPGGRQADVCYWLDTSTGDFVTSNYYRDSPHPWVEVFNHPRMPDRENPGQFVDFPRVVDQWYNPQAPWRRLRPDLDYNRYCTPDDQPGEGVAWSGGPRQGRTFPHPMTGDGEFPDKGYYNVLYNSPFGDYLLGHFAQKAVEAEKLGTHETSDLLCLSFSSNDPVGHCWGPDSHEVLDCTLRSDLVVQELLEVLDARVGRGNYTVVVTADHGVSPLPELVRARGIPSDRIALDMDAADVHLKEVFGGEGKQRTYIETELKSQLHLNQAYLKSQKLDPATVEDALADWARRQPGIAAAYPRHRILAGLPADDHLGQSVVRSYHPDRGGDVVVVLKPYYMFKYTKHIEETGTTHGTPYSYDTHVPLIVWGPGVAAGVRHDLVSPQAAAPILSRALGVPAPRDCDVPLPAGVFR